MKAINVLRYVKIDDGWKLLPLVRSGEKLDWSHLAHNGKLVPLASTEGTFYLDWREDGKRIRRAVGDTVREVKSALALQIQVVTLRDQGVEAANAPQIVNRKTKRAAKKANRIRDEQSDLMQRINKAQQLVEELKSELRTGRVAGGPTNARRLRSERRAQALPPPTLGCHGKPVAPSPLAPSRPR